jgi:hypothetical protein
MTAPNQIGEIASGISARRSWGFPSIGHAISGHTTRSVVEHTTSWMKGDLHRLPKTCTT